MNGVQGRISFLTKNEGGLFWIVEYEKYSYFYKMDEMSGMQELIIKKQGKVNALIADEKYLYFCIDSKHSRFYYRLFQIDLASGVCTSINNPVDLNTINEYVVCCYDNAVYYTTNEIDKNNNSIICLNKTISSKKILGAKKKGLLLLMDVCKTNECYCYTNVYSNFKSDLFIYSLNKGHIKINSEGLDSANYGARFLDKNKIVYISNEDQENQYLCLYNIEEETKESLFSTSLGDVDDFCISENDKYIYIKVVSGTKDILFRYQVEIKSFEMIEFPDDISIIEKIALYDRGLYIIAESERKRPSIFKLDEDRWIKIVNGGEYKNGYRGLNIFLKTLGQFNMEILFYKTIKEKKGTIIWLHGGPNAATRCIYNQLFSDFLQKGFDIIAPNYIGSICYGKKYMEYYVKQNERGCEYIIKQCEELINWGRDCGYITQDNVIICGESFGGYLSLCLAIKKIEGISLCVNLFGPLSINDILGRFPKYMSSLPENTFGKERNDLSVIDNIDEDAVPPILVISGSDDMVNNNLESVTSERIKCVSIEHCGHGYDNSNDYKIIISEIMKYL